MMFSTLVDDDNGERKDERWPGSYPVEAKKKRKEKKSDFII